MPSLMLRDKSHYIFLWILLLIATMVLLVFEKKKKRGDDIIINLIINLDIKNFSSIYTFNLHGRKVSSFILNITNYPKMKPKYNP